MNSINKQTIVEIDEFDGKIINRPEFSGLTTSVPNKKIPIQNWFRYLQSFSAPLVEKLINLNGIDTSSTVLDPFCGVGTTLLVCNQNGINSVGFDISPLSVFVSRAKLYADYNGEKILKVAKKVAAEKIWHHNPPKHPIFAKGLSSDSIDAILSLKDLILKVDDKPTKDFLLLALLSIIEEISLIQKDGAHYRYLTKPKSNDPIKAFQNKVKKMVEDIQLRTFQKEINSLGRAEIGDARSLKLDSHSIDFVITSPPYLNRDNYIAQNKMELFLMDFVSDVNEYRDLTRMTLRSHVEASYQIKNRFDMEIVDLLVNEIRKRPINNQKIPYMIHGYFEDMDLVFAELSRCIRIGGKISLVVGNSAWAGVHIEVDKILAKIALNHGFNIDNILVTRYKMNSAQQINTYGKIPIRESIIMATRGEDEK